jgi:hypothetical protein
LITITATFVIRYPTSSSFNDWVIQHLLSRSDYYPDIKIGSCWFDNSSPDTEATIVVSFPARAEDIFSIEDHLLSRPAVLPGVTLVCYEFLSDDLQTAGFLADINSRLTRAGLYEIDAVGSASAQEISAIVGTAGARGGGLGRVIYRLAQLDPPRVLAM